MKLLIQCYTSEQEAVFCNLAIVQFDLTAMLKRRDLWYLASRSEDGDALYELTFWDHSAEFYEGCFDMEEILPADVYEKLERDQFVIVPDDFKLDHKKRPRADFDNPMRTEADTLHVSDDSFHWESTVKHCDVRVETFQIPFTAIS